MVSTSLPKSAAETLYIARTLLLIREIHFPNQRSVPEDPHLFLHSLKVRSITPIIQPRGLCHDFFKIVIRVGVARLKYAGGIVRILSRIISYFFSRLTGNKGQTELPPSSFTRHIPTSKIAGICVLFRQQGRLTHFHPTHSLQSCFFKSVKCKAC